MITAGGVVTTLAGLPGSSGSTDATGNAARFNQPRGIAVDGAGVLYVADTNNHTIRKITAGARRDDAGGPGRHVRTNRRDGQRRTVQRSARRGGRQRGHGVCRRHQQQQDSPGYRCRRRDHAGGLGLAGRLRRDRPGARFNAPEGVAVDSAGVVYVADTVSDTIRKITPGGVVTTLAGFYGSLGAVDGVGPTARFAGPTGVAVDANGNVYVADRTNHTIRKVTPAGNVTTFAGLANTPGSTDGTGSAARFSDPQGIAVDSAGTVYVADGRQQDPHNHARRRRVTLAGWRRRQHRRDGRPRDSMALEELQSTARVTCMWRTNNNHTIRKIAPGGIVTTLAGLAGIKWKHQRHRQRRAIQSSSRAWRSTPRARCMSPTPATTRSGRLPPPAW